MLLHTGGFIRKLSKGNLMSKGRDAKKNNKKRPKKTAKEKKKEKREKMKK
jgi:hypothetical protein